MSEHTPTGERLRITQLEAALTDVLRQFWQTGHPGYAALRTGWVNVTTVDRWRKVLLDQTTPGLDIIVARDGGRYCEHCEGEITRGQAYAIQPGTGGLLEHVHCPDGTR